MKNLKESISEYSLLSHGEYKSFRVYGKVQDFFFDPAKLILLAGLVLVNVVNLNLAQVYLQPEFSSQPKVLGEATSSEVTTDQAIYKLSIKSLVSSYLNRRSDFLYSQPTQSLSADQILSWQDLVELTRNQVIKLRVPSRYKELHLSIVSILTQEQQVLTKSDGKNVDMSQVSRLWQSTLSEYPWLNE